MPAGSAEQEAKCFFSKLVKDLGTVVESSLYNQPALHDSGVGDRAAHLKLPCLAAVA